jgi:hypothetical protein
MFSSTPLNMALSALELPLASVSSSGLQSATPFRLVEPSAVRPVIPLYLLVNKISNGYEF